VVQEHLDILYRFEAGPKLTEIRSGEVRPDGEGVLAVLRLNQRGEILLRDLERIRDGKTEKLLVPPVETEEFAFEWLIPATRPGDVLRFTTEQPVDLTINSGGAWVWMGGVSPMERGTLRLELPKPFAGSVHSDPAPAQAGRYEWEMKAGDPVEIEVNSFGSWPQLSSWLAGQCPAVPTAQVRAFARMVTANAGSTGDKVRALAKVLTEKTPVATSEDRLFPCMPLDKVLEAEDVFSPNLGALFAAALEALEIPAERFLLNEEPTESVRFGAIASTLVRVKTPGEELWYDMLHLSSNQLQQQPRQALQPLAR
jgi:hypothetical protein